MPIRNSHWYISGTSSGLGHALADYVLSFNDTFVTGISRHQNIFHDRYRHILADLTDAGSTAAIDFQFPTDVTQMVLINNAGMLGDIAHAGNLNTLSIEQTYHINCVAPHVLMNAFIRTLSDRSGDKVIINITSGAGHVPYDGWSLYCASKAALDMTALCIAKEQEMVPDHLRCKVFNIAPGVMDTPMQVQIRSADSAQFSRKEKFVELNKNNKLYNVHDVAARLYQLVDNAGYMHEVVQRIVL